MSMRVLVVDDERPARTEFRYVLARTGAEADVDEAETAELALKVMARRTYDVVFLDIRMPGMSGLAALPRVRACQPDADVVFVTAYDDHAIEAFDLAAADYLLKPVSEPRLRRTLERLAARRSTGHSSVDKLPVTTDTGTLILRIAEIRFVEARGHSTFAKTFDAAHRTRYTLSELERRLRAHGLVRCHRGFLVNPDHVVSMAPFFGGTYVLRMDDRERTEVPVSRAAAPAVRATLGL